MTKPNEPACSECSHLASRVEELENLIAKHSGSLNSADSASNTKGETMAKETRLLTAIERLGKLLREPHHGLAPWTDSTLKCVREITDYLGITLDAKQWHEFMNKVRNEAHLFPPSATLEILDRNGKPHQSCQTCPGCSADYYDTNFEKCPSCGHATVYDLETA